MNRLLRIHIALLTILTIGCNAAPAVHENDTQPVSHELWNALLKKHVSAAGVVNYKGFIADSTRLNKYLQQLGQNPPNEKNWSKNEQMAYWINAYNAFTVQLIMRNYPLKSIKDIGSKIKITFVNTPWDIKFIKIGNQKYDLNNIEHGILRKKFDDPRIHFALVCAAKSCPRLRNEAYVADKLDQQLTDQGKDFLSNPAKNKITPDQAQLSKYFTWYKGDFTKNSSLIDYLNQFAPVKMKPNAEITFLEYNWALNE